MDHLVFWMYRGLSAVGLYAPAPVTWLVSKVVVAIAWRFLPARRDLIRRHLRRITAGELSDPELEAAMRDAYESYRRYWVDSIHRWSGR